MPRRVPKRHERPRGAGSSSQKPNGRWLSQRPRDPLGRLLAASFATRTDAKGWLDA